MTNPTPHGQVPEALIDLIDASAETRHRCGGIYNARTEAALSEAAPQQEAQEPVATLHCNDIGYVWARATEVGTRMRFEQPINLYTAPQPVPVAQGDAEDAARYRWLKSQASEKLLNPRAALSEICADMRTHWKLPTLICSGPVGGYLDFDASIDAARSHAKEGQSHD